MKARKILSGLLASAMALTSVAILNIGASAATEPAEDETIATNLTVKSGTYDDKGGCEVYFSGYGWSDEKTFMCDDYGILEMTFTATNWGNAKCIGLVINSGDALNGASQGTAYVEINSWNQNSGKTTYRIDCSQYAEKGFNVIGYKIYRADGNADTDFNGDITINSVILRGKETIEYADQVVEVPELWKVLPGVFEASNVNGDVAKITATWTSTAENNGVQLQNEADTTLAEFSGYGISSGSVSKVVYLNDFELPEKVKFNAWGIDKSSLTLTIHNDKSKGKVYNIYATGVNINQASASIAVGKTLQLTATVDPENTTDDVVWSSNAKDIVTVDENGLITAVKAGKATITATAGDVSDTCEITVTQPAESVEIGNGTIMVSKLELKKGETATLVAEVKPDDTTNKAVTWTSSDATVATVDANGKVTAVKSGTATITATTKDGSNKKATCEVVVTNPATAISIADMTVLTGAEKDIVVETTPADADDIGKVTYTVEDGTVASVADGKVKGLKAGTTNITATAGTLTTTFKVTVTDEEVPATSVSLNKTEISIEVDASETLTATVTPTDTTDVAVWSSADETIATVDQTGKVTGVKEGETTITVKLNDTVSASCKVTVTKKTIAITGITLDKETAELTEGETVDLVATVVPDDTTEDKTVTWSSSDETVATVENGTVTAVKEGKATITAKIGDFTAECEVTVKAKAADTSDSSSTDGKDEPKDEITPTEDSAVKDVAVSEKDEGAIPEGATNIKVSGNADNTKEGQISYDIVFVDEEGNVVEFSGDKMITVSLPVPEEFKDQSDKIKVYYTPDGKTFTDMKATVKDGVISFDTNHFSTYIISVNELASDEPDPNVPTGIIIAVVPAIAAAGALVIFRKRK